jgi:hypothetical protein
LFNYILIIMTSKERIKQIQITVGTSPDGNIKT